jgi:hypothetical protein
MIKLLSPVLETVMKHTLLGQERYDFAAFLFRNIVDEIVRALKLGKGFMDR